MSSNLPTREDIARFMLRSLEGDGLIDGSWLSMDDVRNENLESVQVDGYLNLLILADAVLATIPASAAYRAGAEAMLGVAKAVAIEPTHDGGMTGDEREAYAAGRGDVIDAIRDALGALPDAPAEPAPQPDAEDRMTDAEFEAFKAADDGLDMSYEVGELLLCPFCGGIPGYAHGEDEDGVFVAVGCSSCGAGSRQHYPLMDDAKPHAANAWNSRVAYRPAQPAEPSTPVAIPPEPVIRAVERVLDECSAWIARPSPEVTMRVALAAGIAWQAGMDHQASRIPEMDARISALEAEVAALREQRDAALKFVPAYEPWMDVYTDEAALDRSGRLVGDLRRARALLQEGRGNG